MIRGDNPTHEPPEHRYEGRNCGDPMRVRRPGGRTDARDLLPLTPPGGDGDGDESLLAARHVPCGRAASVRRRLDRVPSATGSQAAAPPAPIAATASRTARRAGRRFAEGRLPWSRAVTRGSGVKLRNGLRVRVAVAASAGIAVLALAPGASAAFRPLFTATSSGDVVTAQLQPVGRQRRHGDACLLRAAELRREARRRRWARSSALRRGTPGQPHARRDDSARRDDPRRTADGVARAVSDLSAAACSGSTRSRPPGA